MARHGENVGRAGTKNTAAKEKLISITLSTAAATRRSGNPESRRLIRNTGSSIRNI